MERSHTRNQAPKNRAVQQRSAAPLGVRHKAAVGHSCSPFHAHPSSAGAQLCACIAWCHLQPQALPRQAPCHECAAMDEEASFPLKNQTKKGTDKQLPPARRTGPHYTPLWPQKAQAGHAPQEHKGLGQSLPQKRDKQQLSHVSHTEVPLTQGTTKTQGAAPEHTAAPQALIASTQTDGTPRRTSAWCRGRCRLSSQLSPICLPLTPDLYRHY